MKASLLTISLLAACAALGGCDRGHANPASGVIQTKYPGQVTSGGGTSGQVMARSAKPETNAAYAGGTPHIAGGAGGNTGGAALGGTVAETGQGPTQGVTPPGAARQQAAWRQRQDAGRRTGSRRQRAGWGGSGREP
jgi:hypothetical protein